VIQVDLRFGEHSMVIITHKLKIPKQILTVFSVTIISLGLFLTQVSSDSLSKSFGQTPNSIENQTLSTRPPQFGAPPELSAIQKNASTTSTCSLTSPSIRLQGTPQQTEGPYFVDGMPNRSDIRSDTSNGSVEQGIPLRLIIHVYDVDNGSCVPLRGAKVDIWHANSQGIYSAVKDMGTTEKNFLRGYQMTDNNGTVQFTTIYPGWYEGRAIHIHDKVRTLNGSEKTLEWTAQLYFNNSINQQVHEQTPYSNHGPPQTTNEEDMIYTGASMGGLIQKNSGEQLMVNLTKQGASYLGTFNIVLNAGQKD
jgi:protocatechuate 3,4-dioxygenase beta subunit